MHDGTGRVGVGSPVGTGGAGLLGLPFGFRLASGAGLAGLPVTSNGEGVGVEASPVGANGCW
jgi:hypothetical protein